MMRHPSTIGAALALLLCTPGAHAAAPAAGYPNKPIRLVAPFPPGGPGDLVGREIGQRFNETWGQPALVDNRPGAGGAIATELVAKAAPDGYTLLIGSSGALVLQPLLSTQLPYDAVHDFAPVSLAIRGPHILVVNAQLPATSVKDLIALAKAKPGQLNFASAGNGSATQMSGELFKVMAGVNIVHVPYKGGVAGLTDLIAGQVQLMFNSIQPVLPLAKTGKLRTLAVTSAQRVAVLPEVPTVAEDYSGLRVRRVVRDLRTGPHTAGDRRAAQRGDRAHSRRARYRAALERAGCRARRQHAGRTGTVRRRRPPSLEQGYHGDRPRKTLTAARPKHPRAPWLIRAGVRSSRRRARDTAARPTRGLRDTPAPIAAGR